MIFPVIAPTATALGWGSLAPPTFMGTTWPFDRARPLSNRVPLTSPAKAAGRAAPPVRLVAPAAEKIASEARSSGTGPPVPEANETVASGLLRVTVLPGGMSLRLELVNAVVT